MNLILASASTSRARLLRAAGVPFAVRPADVDETGVKATLLAKGADASAIADRLAALKATAVSSACPGDLVLGADQVLAFDGELVSKCDTLGQAEALLRRLRGREHALIGAMVLARDGAPVWRHSERVTMTMRPFGDAFLAQYLADAGDGILSAVGCYHLEGKGAQLFARVDGDYFSVLGLSLLPLLAALRDQGVMAR